MLRSSGTTTASASRSRLAALHPKRSFDKAAGIIQLYPQPGPQQGLLGAAGCVDPNMGAFGWGKRAARIYAVSIQRRRQSAPSIECPAK
jgi:hypothetical protein